MGKSTISMAIFYSFLYVYQAGYIKYRLKIAMVDPNDVFPTSALWDGTIPLLSLQDPGAAATFRRAFLVGQWSEKWVMDWWIESKIEIELFNYPLVMWK